MSPSLPSLQWIHDRLVTSGLPGEEDFTLMAGSGVDTVINLGGPEDTLLLPEEDRLATAAGLRYLHLPVTFDRPTFSDYELLRDLLNALYPRKVWIHCAKNYRVSALIFLYNVIDRSVPIPEARARMHEIWQPDGVWQSFLDEALEKYIYQYI